jgi:hypothetical protein
MTAKRAPASYGEAWAQARQSVNAGRLNDPDEHYPYKLDHVRQMLDDNPAMGPDDEGDDVRMEDFMSRRIAEATDDYIAAQAAYLKSETAQNRAAYDSARDDLVAARRAHRRARTDVDGNPVANIVGIADRRDDHLVGRRFRRVGEE